MRRPDRVRALFAALSAIAVVALAGAGPAAAAPGDLVWSRTWNPDVTGSVNTPRMALAPSGDVLVACPYRGSAGSSLRALCYGSDGTLKWSRSYAAPRSGGTYDGYLMDVAVDRYGDFLIAGYVRSDASGNDWVVHALRPNGTLRWVRRIGGTKHADDQPWAVAVDGSGNVVVTGAVVDKGSTASWRTVKFNRSGKVLWTRRTTGTGRSVAVDSSGAIYVTGSEWRRTYGVAKTIRYSPTGGVSWTRSFRNGDDASGWDVRVNRSRVAVAGDTRGRGLLLRYTRAGAAAGPALLSPALSEFRRVGIDARSRVAAGGGSWWVDGCDFTVCRSWAATPFIIVPTGAWDGGFGDLAMTSGGAVAAAGYAYRAGTAYDTAVVLAEPGGGGWVREYSREAASEFYERGTAVAVTGTAVYVAGDSAHGWGGYPTDLVLLKYAR
jgi:hypothetical protein